LQSNNLKTIIQLKIDNMDDVILLLGNHDMHYISLDVEPSTRFDYRIEADAHALFSDNMHLFTNAFQEGKRIFTHAGISKRWFLDDFGGSVKINIAEQLKQQY
jgi:hypothetical protein